MLDDAVGVAPASERGPVLKLVESPEQRELTRRMKGITHDYIDGQVDVPFLEHTLQELDQKYPGLPKHDIELLIGSLHHDRANALDLGFRVFLSREAEKMGTSLYKLTQEQVMQLYGDFDLRKDMEQAEEAALRSYQDALKGYWKGYLIDQSDAGLLSLELQIHRAGREQDPVKRKHLIGELESHVRAALQDVDDFGKRAEYMYLTLIRKFSRDAGVEHLIDAHHSIPRDDLRRGHSVDGVVIVGDRKQNLQMKSFNINSYTEDFQRKELEATEQKLAGSTTSVILVPPNELKECYRLAFAPPGDLDAKNKGQLTRLKRSLLTSLAQTLPEESKRFLVESLLPKIEKKERSTITQKFIDQNSSVNQLINLGLLDEGDIRDSSVLLTAKRVLKENLAAVRSVFSTPDAYLNPTQEDREKLKQALGS